MMMSTFNPTAYFNFTVNNDDLENERIFLKVYTKEAMKTIDNAIDYMSYFTNAFKKTAKYQNDEIVLDAAVVIFKSFRFWPYFKNEKDTPIIRPPKFRFIECKTNGEAFVEFANDDGEKEFAKYFENDSHSNLERIEILLKRWQKHLKEKLIDVMSGKGNAFSIDVIDEIHMCDSIFRSWHNEATAEDLKSVGHQLTPFEETVILEKIMNEYDEVCKTMTPVEKNKKWFNDIMRYTK